MDNSDKQEEKPSSIFGTSFTSPTEESDSAPKSADAPSSTSAKPGQLTEQQNLYLQQQQLQFKQQQQQQFIQYQSMMAQMTPQQQQLMQSQMIVNQQMQQQYQATMLLKQQQQFQQQQKLQAKKTAAVGGAPASAPTPPVPAAASSDENSAAPSDAKGDSKSNLQAQGLAQAHMYAALNYQQQQKQFSQQVNHMNQMNSMNPLLFQQQMIQNMQYRQPQYNNSQYRNNQNKKDDKQSKGDSQTNSTAGAGSTNLATGTNYDETVLQSQLELIMKLKQDQEGGNPNDKTKEVHVAELHGRLQLLVNGLVDKINKKHESLMLSQQQLKVYQDILKQKYNPIFQQMDEITYTKKFEYLDHITKHLEQNNERILLEKKTLQKMEQSFNEIKPIFKTTLEKQLVNIEIQIEKQKKMHAEAEIEQKKAEKEAAEKDDDELRGIKKDEKPTEEEDEEKEAEKEQVDPTQLVDSDKIKSITSMVDEFNNIVAKNFSVYAQYDDFSFANSRSSDAVELKLKMFFQEHFSGDFQLKNSFETSVLPRIFYLEQRTKFIYSYKIMNYMTQAIMIQNKFNIPDLSRYVITPKGHLFIIGGFNPQSREFLYETYFLDEYRSLLKPLNDMFYPRADHVVHQYKDNLYVLGGMAYRDEKSGGKPFVQSLNTCEFFSISSKKWIMLPNFDKPRQAFSVCQFNEKYIFIIGGKCLKPEARIGHKLSFDYVQEVEAFDIEKNIWKTVNYITDNLKLRIIHAGATQVTGKKIMIFGGMVEHEEGDDDKDTMIDNGQTVKLSDQSLFLDVTKGSIKRGPNLVTASYYVNNGGNLLCMQNKLYAQGFGVNHDLSKSQVSTNLQALAASQTSTSESKLQDSSKDAQNSYHHKKILHCYNQNDQEFSEIYEGIFSAGGTRKQSFDLEDA